MDKKLILRECLIWLFSFLIAWVIWMPITTKIPYNHIVLGLFAIIMMIQFFRWFVFYDQVILFQRKYYILASILIFFTIGAVTWSKGQEVLLLSENQAIEDIATTGSRPVIMGLEASYELFRYLRNLLILCNFGTPGLAFSLILKIIYKTIGMGSNKVKAYLGK